MNDDDNDDDDDHLFEASSHSREGYSAVELGALEVCSRQGTIQIHAYLTLPSL